MDQHSRPWRPQLTQGELYRGWAFLGLYFVVFPLLLYLVRAVLDTRLALSFSDAAVNAAYYFFCAAVVVVLFFSFLKHGFFILLDHLPENLFALGSGLAGCVILTVALGVLPLPVENPILYTYPEQFAMAPGTTVAILVLLQPIIEEILFRGLLFGGLRRHGRALAWAVSIALFLIFKVWQFAIVPGQLDLRYFLLAAQYLPLALAVTWCYNIGGSIWSVILLRVLLNGASLWLLL